MAMTASATWQPQPTPLLVERRFPLDLEISAGDVRDLYESAKRARWDPARDIPWAGLHATAYSPEVSLAARQVWSRRAWLEYTGLAETPALLIRFCLEAGREADPKYFLTVRNTEEAWHVESCHRVAQALGGYVERPADPRWEPLFNQTLYRQALDSGTSLDAYVAVHCALEDGLELVLCEAWFGAARDPAVRSVLEHMSADKRRHAEFGWRYLSRRSGSFDAATRALVEHHLALWVREVAMGGYHVASLATAVDADPERKALEHTADAGLGAVRSQAEEALFVAYLDRARARLGALGLSLPRFSHPRIGEV
jgi:hypothetical protein